jgi:hypothetical protein
LFPKDRFVIDLGDDTVTCPAGVTVTIGRGKDGGGVAKFAAHCKTCPLAKQCTKSHLGRKVRVGVNEAALTRARAEQADPAWRADYRATRPKVERKLGHLMRRRHGGRRARVRGRLRVDADFALLAAATNLARLATLKVRSIPGKGWAVAGWRAMLHHRMPFSTLRVPPTLRVGFPPHSFGAVTRGAQGILHRCSPPRSTLTPV